MEVLSGILPCLAAGNYNMAGVMAGEDGRGQTKGRMGFGRGQRQLQSLPPSPVPSPMPERLTLASLVLHLLHN